MPEPASPSTEQSRYAQRITADIARGTLVEWVFHAGNKKIVNAHAVGPFIHLTFADGSRHAFSLHCDPFAILWTPRAVSPDRGPYTTIPPAGDAFNRECARHGIPLGEPVPIGVQKCVGFGLWNLARAVLNSEREHETLDMMEERTV